MSHLTSVQNKILRKPAIFHRQDIDLDTLPACDQVGQYYKHDPIDIYAAILHEYAILEKAYAFGYEDVSEQSSVGITKNPTKLVLTVHPVAS